MFKTDKNEVVEVDDRANIIVINLSTNLTYMLNIRALRESTFLISDIKKTFHYL